MLSSRSRRFARRVGSPPAAFRCPATSPANAVAFVIPRDVACLLLNDGARRQLTSCESGLSCSSPLLCSRSRRRSAARRTRRFHVNLGGGPTFNAGDLGEHFATGWGPAIGVTFDAPTTASGFQFEYAYRWFDIKDDAPVLRGDLVFGQPPDPSAGLQPRREPDAARERGSPLLVAGPGLLPPQGGDHGVRRQRRHLRPLLVRVRHLPGRAT